MNRDRVHGLRGNKRLIGFSILAAGVFAAGLAIGSAVQKDALNWGRGTGTWMIGVTDRYELRLSRPVVDGGVVPDDVDARTWSVADTARGLVRTHPLKAEVRLVPYILSGRWAGPTEFGPESDVRLAFTRKTPVHTNGSGEVKIEGHYGGSGPSTSINTYVPPRLGATFVIGDGRNRRGGFSFFELRVRQGRIWSEGSLFRFDCAPSGLFGTCREVSLEAAIKLGPVQHIHPRMGGAQINGMNPIEDSSEGTLVQAQVLLPSDADEVSR